MFYSAEYCSPLGKLTLATDGQALAGLWIKGQKYFAGRLSLTPIGDHPVLRQAMDWLDRYFAGKQPAVSELPLAPVGTDFQKLVWNLLLEIPYGEHSTYGALAKQAAQALNRPSMSAQAVGSAVGRNPISIIIPCHRVLGSDGSLTGYAGGLDRKRWLLQHEGLNLI